MPIQTAPMSSGKFNPNHDAIAAYLDGAIRLLYNSSRDIFIEIWGEDGPYLWDKFTGPYDCSEGRFICYLDHGNQRLLARAVEAYALKNDPRSKGGV